MNDTNNRVSFRFDAPETSPRAFTEDLAEIVRTHKIETDSYTLGGSVAECEEAFAKLFNKEKAVFMPTGTLANHLAVRALTKTKNRVLVQERGHLYNDCGDCLQSLSGINVIPLGYDKATFSLEEVKAAVSVAESSRVRVGIGAIVVETPVRRKHGELFDHHEMKQICTYARKHEIGLHLDGARLFIASAYTGIPVAEYAAEFDTVYVSLYKYFGTPSGAVLVGSAALLDGIHHERRMFGGALSQAWMFAAATLKHMAGFGERFALVVAESETFKQRLRGIPDFCVSDIPNGTNVFRLGLRSGLDLEKLHSYLNGVGIRLPHPENGVFYLKANESILSMPLESLTEHFADAIECAVI